MSKDPNQFNFEYESRPVIDISTERALQKAISIALQNVHVYSDLTSSKTYIIIDPETSQARNVSIEGVTDHLALILKGHDVIVSEKKLTSAVKTWAMTAQRIKHLPPSFSIDTRTPAFIQINLSSLSSGSTPTWDSFIDRCGNNGNALMAFVWSLFETGHENHQYLFLRGPGGDGKGSLTRWLTKRFSCETYNATASLSASDPRWTAQLVGKRIGFFHEIKATSIVLSTYFKAITGGDPVTIDPKNVPAYTAKLDAKLILTTNDAISISSGAAEKRRAIIVDIKPTEKIIPNYENLLEEESNAFLFKCKQAYDECYRRDQKSIRCNYEDFEDASDSFEEEYELILENQYEIIKKKPIESEPEFQIRRRSESISATNFISLLRSETRDPYKQKEFKSFIERKYKIKKSRISSGDEQRKSIYLGLKSKGIV